MQQNGPNKPYYYVISTARMSLSIKFNLTSPETRDKEDLDVATHSNWHIAA